MPNLADVICERSLAARRWALTPSVRLFKVPRGTDDATVGGNVMSLVCASQEAGHFPFAFLRWTQTADSNANEKFIWAP